MKKAILNQLEGKALHDGITKKITLEGHSKTGRCVRAWGEDLEDLARATCKASELQLVRVTTIKENI